MEQFIEALERYTEAKAEYNEAAKNCLYDKDYFLHREIEAVKETKKQLQIEFNKAVLSVIENNNNLCQTSN